MNKPKKVLALYPGTFDPITNGHTSLIDRALALFDEVVVAVARSTHKDTLFTAEERFDIIKRTVGDTDRVRVEIFDLLLADYARQIGASAIVRGLRAVSDFEYEFQLTLMNRRLERSIETVFLMPALSWVYLSSTIVKEVARFGGSVNGLVPPAAAEALAKKFKK